MKDFHPSIALTADWQLFRVTQPNPPIALGQLLVAPALGGKIGAWKQLDPGADIPMHVAASPVGHKVALGKMRNRVVGGVRHINANNTLELFDSRKPGERQLLLTTKTPYGTPPNFSADGRFLVWPDPPNHTVNVWRAADGQLLRAIPTVTSIMGFALSSDGSRVAAGGEDKRCRVWSVADGQEIANWLVPGLVTGIEFHPNGTLIVAYCEFDEQTGEAGHERLWIRDAVNNRTKVLQVFEQGFVGTMMASPDGQFFAISGSTFNDNRIRLWRWDQLAP
jgi:WD40 repeat protein